MKINFIHLICNLVIKNTLYNVVVYKEVISHYVNNNTSVYSCLFDASKAFDRVHPGNIDWLNTNESERKRFYNILKTFGFVQNICTETHRSHHLLDYIITRKDCNIISDYTVSDFILDHRVLHASLQCLRPHPVRKQIAVRVLRRIKDDALAEDLDCELFHQTIHKHCLARNTQNKQTH